ncbi:MAG: hypothetical protein EXR99_08795 [Gemmataceae bacterium]|nr:hypothetical protein [Gemmataceae bacterium]
MENPSKPTIVFVYNASSGFFNLIADITHKVMSPSTYPCNLCALTHAAFSMRREWRDFLSKLRFPLEFLHRDGFKQKTGRDDELPAILVRKPGNEWMVLVPAVSLKALTGLDDLKKVIHEQLVLEGLLP